MATACETIYIVDDDDSTRRSLSLLFGSVGFEVRAYADGRRFLESGEPRPPGCILLDIRMRPISGLHVQEVLRGRGNPVPIIFMSAHADVPVTVNAMKGGACDLIEKPFSEPALLETVQRVLDQHRSQWEQDGDGAHAKRLKSLTARERQVAELVATGKSSKEIADALTISLRTVEVHRCRALRKAGAQNTAQLVQWLSRLTACGSTV